MEGLSVSIGNLSVDQGFGNSDTHVGSSFTTKAASLSMKMRSEGTKQLSRTSAFPPVNRKSQCKNIHSPKVIPKSEVSRMYERLSGQFVSEGYESFPDRGTIHHPSTFCVRCSAHASMCVPCADDMSNKAVNFFRKSQALGAYHLLSGAIKQAGCQTVVRSLTFHLWKNYLKENSAKREKRKVQSQRQYEINLMTPTFNAWVSLTKWTVKDKHIKRVIECEDRIKLLEAQVQKLNTEKNIAEFQATKASKSYDACMTVNHDQAANIRLLTKSLCKEQYRVLKLSTFVHSVTPQLLSILGQSAKGVTQASSKQVQFCQSLTASSMNYAKVLKPNANGKGAASKAKKVTATPPPSPGRATAFSSWSERSAELVAWVNHHSRNANTMTLADDSGGAIELDKFLPPFREIARLTELRNGQQLCRVVVKLVMSIQSQRAAGPKAPPPKAVGAPGPAPPAGLPPVIKAEPPFTLTREHAQDIKENMTEPRGLIFVTQTLMANALKCPEFDIEHIESADPLAIEALIGSLMLINADSDGEVSAEDKADLIKFSSAIDHLKVEIDKTITKSVAARMLTFPDSFFRDEEKEKRLEEERKFALENKDRLRREKREADKAARLEAKKKPSQLASCGSGEGKADEVSGTDSHNEDSDGGGGTEQQEEKAAEEEKASGKKGAVVSVDPIMDFVESHRAHYDELVHIIDLYFGARKGEQLDELAGCIGTLDESLKVATDQLGVMLRKEKTAFGNLQFTIHTNNHIALSNTTRMVAALRSKESSDLGVRRE